MAQVRIRKRGKTYSYIFEAGKTVDGRRKVIEKGGFPTKAQAYDAGVAAYNDWKHGNIGIVSENISLKDFVTNWLENVVALDVKPTSMQAYRSIVKTRLFPLLGNIAVQDLTPALLDNWFRGLQKEGLSKNYLSQIHALIHHALDYAVYPCELIKSNPANYIKVPRKAPTNIIPRVIIPLEQFKALLAKYPFGTPYYIPLLILYHTGIRLGELLGLTWDNVDFDRKTIVIEKQVVRVNRQGYFLTSTKTKTSNRRIPIDDFLANELLRWKDQQAANERAFVESYVYNYRDSEGKLLKQSKGLGLLNAEGVCLVCVRNDGRYILKENFVKVLRRLGLNAHSFRHTHATMLIENGASPKGVAGRLGHSNTLITQNLYTHNTEKLQDDTVAIFEKTLQTKP